jgi:hypothetical protein
VVERAHEQHGIRRRVGVGQAARVPDRGIERDSGFGGRRARLLDVQRHRIDEPDVVAMAGEPDRVHAGAAADVENPGRRNGKVPRQQVHRARPLQDAGVPGETRSLDSRLVVLEDLALHRRRGYRRASPPSIRIPS